MLKKFILRIFIFAVMANLAACSPYVEWKEEVNLSDGRVIVVEQKRRDYNGIAVESWLTMNLPDISSQPIVWHETLGPLVANIYEGQLYVVGKFFNGESSKKYGCHQESYVNFVWNKGVWNRIPFNAIPEQIYKTNMLIDDFPPDRIDFLTLAKKNSAEVNGRGTLPLKYRKLSPVLGNAC